MRLRVKIIVLFFLFTTSLFADELSDDIGKLSQEKQELENKIRQVQQLVLNSQRRVIEIEGIIRYLQEKQKTQKEAE